MKLAADLLEAIQTDDAARLRLLLPQHPHLLHELLDSLMGWDFNWNEDDAAAHFATLRAAGVDANALDAEGRSALARVLNDVDRPYIACLLVEVLGADPNLPVVRDQCLEAVLGERNMDEPFELLVGELGCVLPPVADCRYMHLLLFGEARDGEFYVHMLERLLHMDAIRVHERDEDQDTPLHCVMYPLNYTYDHFLSRSQLQKDEAELEVVDKLVALLLGRGADPLAQNKYGSTPLDVWLAENALSLPGDTDAVEERLRNAMADAQERLDAAKWEAFVEVCGARRLGMSICTDVLRPLVLAPRPRGRMWERKKRLDAMLQAEGIRCDGHYYEQCLSGEVSPIDMREFRLRHVIATTGAGDYERILDELRDDNGGRYFNGIHALAREVFRTRYPLP